MIGNRAGHQISAIPLLQPDFEAEFPMQLLVGGEGDAVEEHRGGVKC